MDLVSDNRVEIKAPAKINLLLAIKSKRPDGYHELETIMQKVDLFDRLCLKKKESGVSLSCSIAGGIRENTPPIPEDEGNIAFKAAALFFEKTSVAGGVHISLEKRIPVAAGLGGGSSDAAAVLLALQKLYKTDLSFDELKTLGGKLGADVPFFVDEKSSATFAKGVGDKLNRIKPLSKCWIILLNPAFLVSTKWVYDNFALTTEKIPYTLGADLLAYQDSKWLKGTLNSLAKHKVLRFYNDLERVTCSKYPILRDLIEQIKSAGACLSMMSGSGPTLFGIFDTKDTAENCYKNLNKSFTNVFICKPT